MQQLAQALELSIKAPSNDLSRTKAKGYGLESSKHSSGCRFAGVRHRESVTARWRKSVFACDPQKEEYKTVDKHSLVTINSAIPWMGW